MKFLPLVSDIHALGRLLRKCYSICLSCDCKCRELGCALASASVSIRENSQLAPGLDPTHAGFTIRRCIVLDFSRTLKMPACSQLHAPGSLQLTPSVDMGRGKSFCSAYSFWFLHNWKLEVCKQRSFHTSLYFG